MTTLTPVQALHAAIEKFDSKADFVRALNAQRSPRRAISWSYVLNWLHRGGGRGAPAEFAPDIEAVSGVPVEWLRPNVSWHVIRGCKAPRPRIRRSASAAMAAEAAAAPAPAPDSQSLPA